MTVAVRPSSTFTEEEAPPRPLRWTRAQYYKMAELGYFAGKRVELREGEITEMPPIGPVHQAITTAVSDLFRGAFGASFFVREQAPLSVGTANDPLPDIAVIQGRSRDFLGGHPTTASLVAEISVSTLDYDRAQKSALYAEGSIPEYWIINITERQLEVYRQPMLISEGVFGYADVKIYMAQETLAPLSAPDVQIAVASLLP